MPEGHLVVVEGIDGVGKSTVVEGLVEALEGRGHDVVPTREPTDTYRGETLRRSLSDEGAPPGAEALLFMADHAGHVDWIRDRLEGAPDRVVVSDRYAESCYAYQGAILEEPLAEAGIDDPVDWIRSAIGPFHRDPDLALVLDLHPEEALARSGGREGREKFERADVLGRVRERYHGLADRFPWVELVDASPPAEEVVAAARSRVEAVVG
jgi:dTMP kinase